MKKVFKVVMVVILLSAVLLSFSCKKEAEKGETADSGKKGEFLYSAVQAIQPDLILQEKQTVNHI